MFAILTSITAVGLTGFPFQNNIAQTLMYSLPFISKLFLSECSLNNLFIKWVDVFFVPFKVYECACKSFFLFKTVTE